MKIVDQGLGRFPGGEIGTAGGQLYENEAAESAGKAGDLGFAQRSNDENGQGF